jgi:hypothetical protein
MANFFNWTVTYRWDSDMVRPYGYVKPIGNVPLHPSESQMKEYLSNSKVNYANGKTKMAAWFVTNCHSKSSRNEMVQELQKYVQVDVYGGCGTLSCPKKPGEDASSEECLAMAAKNYKFYMALENSLCLDYITEKSVKSLAVIDLFNQRMNFLNWLLDSGFSGFFIARSSRSFTAFTITTTRLHRRIPSSMLPNLNR